MVRETVNRTMITLAILLLPFALGYSQEYKKEKIYILFDSSAELSKKAPGGTSFNLGTSVSGKFTTKKKKESNRLDIDTLDASFLKNIKLLTESEFNAKERRIHNKAVEKNRERFIQRK